MARYIANVALSIKGDRIEKGAEVELSEEDVARIDPADVTATADVVVDEAEPEVDLATIPLEEMTHAQLKAHAKALGLSAGGSAADIRERIALQLEGSDDANGNPEGGDQTDDDANGNPEGGDITNPE